MRTITSLGARIRRPATLRLGWSGGFFIHRFSERSKIDLAGYSDQQMPRLSSFYKCRWLANRSGFSALCSIIASLLSKVVNA